MGNAFISYRHEDTAGYAGRLYDRLNAVFPERVFMDVTRLDPGVDFVDEIQKAVGNCSALIVLIGKNWAIAADGAHRLQDPNDWVRLEVGHALERRIRVIPVLIGNATLPGEDVLPAELSPLLRRQALKIDDAAFDYSVNELVEVLEKELGVVAHKQSRPGRAGSGRKLMGIGAGIFAALFLIAVIGMMMRKPAPDPTPGPAPVPESTQLPTRAPAPVAPVSPTPGPAPTQRAQTGVFNPVGNWTITPEDPADTFILSVSANGTFVAEMPGGGPSSTLRGNWQYEPLARTLVIAGQEDQGGYLQEVFQIGGFQNGHYEAQAREIGNVIFTQR